MKTKNQNTIPSAKAAILALAEIKAAMQAFDRGETNLFDALDSIIGAVEAYHATASAKPIHPARRRAAA